MFNLLLAVQMAYMAFIEALILSTEGPVGPAVKLLATPTIPTPPTRTSPSASDGSGLALPFLVLLFVAVFALSMMSFLHRKDVNSQVNCLSRALVQLAKLDAALQAEQDHRRRDQLSAERAETASRVEILSLQAQVFRLQRALSQAGQVSGAQAASVKERKLEIEALQRRLARAEQLCGAQSGQISALQLEVSRLASQLGQAARDAEAHSASANERELVVDRVRCFLESVAQSLSVKVAALLLCEQENRQLKRELGALTQELAEKAAEITRQKAEIQRWADASVFAQGDLEIVALAEYRANLRKRGGAEAEKQRKRLQRRFEEAFPTSSDPSDPRFDESAPGALEALVARDRKRGAETGFRTFVEERAEKPFSQLQLANPKEQMGIGDGRPLEVIEHFACTVRAKGAK